MNIQAVKAINDMRLKAIDQSCVIDIRTIIGKCTVVIFIVDFEID